MSNYKEISSTYLCKYFPCINALYLHNYFLKKVLLLRPFSRTSSRHTVRVSKVTQLTGGRARQRPGRLALEPLLHATSISLYLSLTPEPKYHEASSGS